MSMSEASRPKADSVEPVLRLWPYLSRHPGQLACAAVSLLAAAGLTLTFPVALRRVIDHGFAAGQDSFIEQYFLALLAVVGFLAIATAVRFYLVTLIGERLIADLRADLYRHLLTMSPRFFESMRTGEVIARLTSDMAVIQGVVGSTISIALRNSLLLSGAVAMMMVTSFKLTALVVVLAPIVVVPLILMGRRLRGLARESQERIAEASGIIGEVLQAISVVQAFTAETDATRRGVSAVERAYDLARRRTRLRSALTGLVIFLVATGVVSVVWVGASDVASGDMSAGRLGQFVFYAVFVGASGASLSEVWGSLQLAAGAAERVFELLDAPSDFRGPTRPLPQPARGEIEFRDVTFRYPGRPDHAALKGFSLRIEPGQQVALVGPSGAGKSTLFQMLLRFYDPDSGSVLMDGMDLRELDPVALRERYALVPQDPAIFARSAAANIALGREDASGEQVEAAARMADAHEFLSALPKGYDTWLGERGVMLSGGQNQRLAIARAVLRDAPVLLLDEATSALDARSERAVQDALARCSEGRTVLVIAHRLATVQRADRIVVMDGGQVVAEGRHEELVAAGGLYASLAKLQFDALA